jgi:hypothetical protein
VQKCYSYGKLRAYIGTKVKALWKIKTRGLTGVEDLIHEVDSNILYRQDSIGSQYTMMTA